MVSNYAKPLLVIYLIEKKNYCLSYPIGSRLRLPTQYWVPRVRLYFAAEDPKTFAGRVAEAFYKRRETEALIRYNLYVDCMPMEGVGELDQASLKRMTEWAKGAPSLAKDKSYVMRQMMIIVTTGSVQMVLPERATIIYFA